MYTLISCNGFKVVGTVSAGKYDSLPSLCRAAEAAIDDGFAVYATWNGVYIADAEGFSHGLSRCSDAATATGVYDRG